ncbi:hypothetical protein [Brevibacillus daliensis]|uniref:hypothetical protein n=1 Tax=Brevibacillus daliensis TaxID=2892995 RepID=UPI001E39330A|nr:hypothetical protein [Brevibacillus daliensis]
MIRETLQQIEEQLAPEAFLQVKGETRLLEEMATLLQSSTLPHERKQTILGCYALLTAAYAKHSKLSYQNPELAKEIIDGDYLQSFYYEYAFNHGERELVLYLAPVMKQIQIKKLEGKPTDRLLLNKMKSFVDKVDRQVTYEVSRTS